MTALGPLLSHAIGDISGDFDAGVAASGGDIRLTLVLWADLLRAVPDGGISFSDLPVATRVSRRVLKTAETYGRDWLKITPLKPKGKLWRLTPPGARLRDLGSELVQNTEAQWAAKVGETEVARLRAALEKVVAGLDFELPHYPMPYGGGDARALGGFAVAAKAGPPPIPAHGTDWVPVVRGDGDTVSALPLHALLSQAYMAYKIAVEERVLLGVAVVAEIARVMPTGQAPLEDVAHLGVDGRGKSSLERHGVVTVKGSGKNRVARLTSVARRLPEVYEPAMAEVEKRWRDTYGDRVVTELRKSLEAVGAKLASDLPDHVVVYVNRWRAGAA
jgi:hypothetical protein